MKSHLRIQTQNRRKKMEQRIKGTTGLLALIGSPVGHSGSPDMYNFCLPLSQFGLQLHGF